MHHDRSIDPAARVMDHKPEASAVILICSSLAVCEALRRKTERKKKYAAPHSPARAFPDTLLKYVDEPFSA